MNTKHPRMSSIATTSQDRCYHLNYELILDLESHLVKQGSPEFSKTEFLWLFDCFDYYQTENGKWKLFNFFKTLPHQEIVSRASSISRLVSLLNRVRANSLSPSNRTS